MFGTIHVDDMFVCVVIGLLEMLRFERKLRVMRCRMSMCNSSVHALHSKLTRKIIWRYRTTTALATHSQHMRLYFTGLTAWYIVHVFDFNFHFGRENIQRKWIASAARRHTASIHPARVAYHFAFTVRSPLETRCDANNVCAEARMLLDALEVTLWSFTSV